MITWGIFGSVVAGLVAGVVIGQITEYYTSDEYKPTKGIAEQANMGPATAIIDALTEPVLRPFRRLVPPMGGLDLSPLFAMLILFALSILISGLKMLPI